MTNSRKTKKEIIRSILTKILQGRYGVSIYWLSKETKINFSTVRDYVDLIEYAQSLPKIYVLRNPDTNRTTIAVHPSAEEELTEKFKRFLEKRGRGETIKSIETLDPDEKKPIYLKFLAYLERK